jgi:hypothetical protein
MTFRYLPCCQLRRNFIFFFLNLEVIQLKLLKDLEHISLWKLFVSSIPISEEQITNARKLLCTCFLLTYVPTVASKRFWSSMSFQNLVRMSQIKKKSLSDYAHVNKVSKN